MNDEQPKDPYFIDYIIPGIVFNDPELPPFAKMLFGAINGLSSNYGYCNAEDKTLAEKVGAAKGSVYNWLKLLAKKNYITVDYEEKDVEKNIYRGRKIFPSQQFAVIQQAKSKAKKEGRKMGKETNFISNLLGKGYPVGEQGTPTDEQGGAVGEQGTPSPSTGGTLAPNRVIIDNTFKPQIREKERDQKEATRILEEIDLEKGFEAEPEFNPNDLENNPPKVAPKDPPIFEAWQGVADNPHEHCIRVVYSVGESYHVLESQVLHFLQTRHQRSYLGWLNNCFLVEILPEFCKHYNAVEFDGFKHLNSAIVSFYQTRGQKILESVSKQAKTANNAKPAQAVEVSEELRALSVSRFATPAWLTTKEKPEESV